MAENEKKAFLLYYDWETLFDSLDSNAEAGELIKALFAFAKRGEITEFSGALKMAFIFMSQQLARDSDKWGDIRAKRKDAINKRWNKQKNTNDTNEYNCIQMNTNDTVTVTDTVNVTDTVTVTGTVTVPKSGKPQKHKFGAYNHVLLTDDEYSKLCDDYGKETADKYIQKVDDYCEMKGKSYKNYNLAIRNTFMSRDNVKPKDDGLTKGADGFFYDKDGNCYV